MKKTQTSYMISKSCILVPLPENDIRTAGKHRFLCTKYSIRAIRFEDITVFTSHVIWVLCQFVAAQFVAFNSSRSIRRL